MRLVWDLRKSRDASQPVNLKSVNSTCHVECLLVVSKSTFCRTVRGSYTVRVDILPGILLPGDSEKETWVRAPLARSWGDPGTVTIHQYQIIKQSNTHTSGSAQRGTSRVVRRYWGGGKALDVSASLANDMVDQPFGLNLGRTRSTHHQKHWGGWNRAEELVNLETVCKYGWIFVIFFEGWSKYFSGGWNFPISPTTFVKFLGSLTLFSIFTHSVFWIITFHPPCESFKKVEYAWWQRQ